MRLCRSGDRLRNFGPCLDFAEPSAVAVRRAFSGERWLARRNDINSTVGVATWRVVAGRSHQRPPSVIKLPEFDSYDSVASWYRDYVSYCGCRTTARSFSRWCSRWRGGSRCSRKRWPNLIGRHAGFGVSGAGLAAGPRVKPSKPTKIIRRPRRVPGHAADLVGG